MSARITLELGEPVVVTLRFAQSLEAASKYCERWPGDTMQYVFSAKRAFSTFRTAPARCSMPA
jgi:hypothetical protein